MRKNRRDGILGIAEMSNRINELTRDYVNVTPMSYTYAGDDTVSVSSIAYAENDGTWEVVPSYRDNVGNLVRTSAVRRKTKNPLDWPEDK